MILGGIITRALIGAAAGAFVGAAGAAMFGGSFLASTAQVWAGAKTFAGLVYAGGLAAGWDYISNNVQNAFANGTQTMTNVYYHVTSKANATKIIESGKISPGEAGRAYVLSFQPTLNQAGSLGARAMETVIRFQTNSNCLIRDLTCSVNGAWFTSNSLPLSIYNITIVGFK